MRFQKSDCLYIAGQCFHRLGREIRAPLCVLHRLARDSRIKVVSHQTSDGEYWFAAEFRSHRATDEAFARLRELYPAAIKTGDLFRRQAGGRDRLMVAGKVISHSGLWGAR
jgi:hypothetical protein